MCEWYIQVGRYELFLRHDVNATQLIVYATAATANRGWGSKQAPVGTETKDLYV